MTTKVRGPAAYFPSIEKKYGRSIAEWQGLMAATGITKHMELVGWLKREHGLLRSALAGCPASARVVRAAVRPRRSA
jgi:hypothetical protein